MTLIGMATLRDVAKEAGVHPKTVSSILNGTLGNTRFGEETRRKVVKVAKRLGYTQNLVARSLRTRRTQTVGLVAGNIQNPFFAELSLQLERNLRQHDLHLVLTCHGADADLDETSLAKLLLARSVDGLLIWSEQRDGRTPRLPRASTTPRVWMGHGPRSEVAATIDIAAGLAMAVGHVRAFGGRRIAFYAPSYSENAGLPKSRPDLLDKACGAAGMPRPRRVLFPGQSWNLDAAVRCAFDFIPDVRSAGIDTVIGYNDVAAVGWQIAAREAGFHCPVIAFDGSPLIRAWKPAMPYVDLHGDVLARHAVELLVALIKGHELGERRALVQPTFVTPPTH